MWFKKKEVEEIKEEKKELLISKRIKSLIEKAGFVKSNLQQDMIRGYRTYYSLLTTSDVTWLVFKLNTAQGERIMLIEDNSLWKSLSYGDNVRFGSDGSYLYMDDPMFVINVSGSKVGIKPKPMTKFTAEEIDLAILEFEHALDDLYKQAQANDEKHQKVVEYFSR